MNDTSIDWAAAARDPRFVQLVRRKRTFLWGLMLISAAYYFLLPVIAAYHPDAFKPKVWGVVNVGLLFALSEFVVAWLLAWIYARRANREFDALAADISRQLTAGKGG